MFGIQQAIAVEHMNTSKHFMLNGQMMCSFVVLIDFAVFGLNTHLYNIYANLAKYVKNDYHEE